MLNPSYMEEIKAWHHTHPDCRLHLFWDKKSAAACVEVDASLTLHRLDDQKFITLMAGCRGYVTTAGFESVCEAMYLGKPVMMIPVHIEQEMNAIDAQGAGAGIVSNEFNITRLLDFIPHYHADTEACRRWVHSAEERFVGQLTSGQVGRIPFARCSDVRL